MTVDVGGGGRCVMFGEKRIHEISKNNYRKSQRALNQCYHTICCIVYYFNLPMMKS